MSDNAWHDPDCKQACNCEVFLRPLRHRPLAGPSCCKHCRHRRHVQYLLGMSAQPSAAACMGARELRARRATCIPRLSRLRSSSSPRRSCWGSSSPSSAVSTPHSATPNPRPPHVAYRPLPLARSHQRHRARPPAPHHHLRVQRLPLLRRHHQQPRPRVQRHRQVRAPACCRPSCRVA